MLENPLKRLEGLGQSIWIDYIRRDLIGSGELARFIEQDGISGMTSNPAIFQKAILGSDDYDDDIRTMSDEGRSNLEIYETLIIQDVQNAADAFRSVYDRTDGVDGYVSLEVNPHLARDTEGTIEEARRLWAALDRPNVFIKVPATLEGLPAITQLIGEGINVNVTLLFGLPRYRETAEAYIRGLEMRARRGEPMTRVASVASFFVSRIDAMVDAMLDDLIAGDGAAAETARQLRGQTAVASAQGAYQIFKEIFHGDRFRELVEKDARPQRVLWASTSTKNPEYPDVKYVESLIGPETVNTAPIETIDAYRDHGDPATRIEDDVDGARAVLRELAEVGIDIDEVTQRLEDEGIEKFNEPFDKLIETLERAKTRV